LTSLEAYRTRLSAGLFDLGAALADLELWIALANHVDSAASLDDLAIWVAVLQRANAANYFHRIDLDRCFVYGLVCFFHKSEAAEYTGSLDTFNAKRGLPIQARQNLQHAKNRLF
jgi:hypothetical protein